MTTTPTAVTIPKIGGDPSLDLVNTVRWRLDPKRRDDTLRSYADAIGFARDVSLVSMGEADELDRLARADVGAAAREVARLRRLPEAVHHAMLEQDSPSPIAAEYVDALRHSTLVPHGDHWEWHLPTDLGLIRNRLAVAAVDLKTDAVAEVRQCADADCGWIFVDRSPRHNRRWCSSEDCGNRNRVREHYERQRARTAQA